MRWGHFYLLDQWEFRDNWQGQRELIHIPCDQPVYRARHGPTWVCMGCYLEPPREMLDVILLGMNDVYKGWDDQPRYTAFPSGPGANFYLGFANTPDFYLVCFSDPSSFYNYIEYSTYPTFDGSLT